MIFNQFISIACCTVLVWLAMEIPFSAQAQTLDCSNASDCLLNPTLRTSGASFGDMDPYGPVQIEGWDISHGTPTVSEENGVLLWSYSGATHGEGIYTCFPFQKDRTYRVCVEVKSNSKPGTLGYEKGYFFIQATNGNYTRPIPVSNQVIAQWQMREQTFTTFQFTFTANRNYTQLWLFPYMAEPPDGQGSQYETLVRKVIVHPVIPAATYTQQGDTIRVAYNSLRPGYWSWSPASAIQHANADSSIVLAQVCSDTLLKGTFVSDCAVCDTARIALPLYSNKPSVSIHGPTESCAGQAIALQASGAQNYQWLGENHTDATLTSSPALSKTYRVVGYQGICSDTADRTVQISPVFREVHDTSICEGSRYHLPDHTIVNKAGTYTTSLLSKTGCDSTIVTQLSLHPTYRISQQIDLTDEASYKLPDGGQVYQSGVHEVVLPSRHNCDSTLVMNIRWQLMIPNLITPNGDYQNDRFEIKGLPKTTLLHLYNQWGRLVYEHTDYDHSWQGEVNTTGLYYYLLRLPDGTEYKGWLHVVR